MHYSSFVRSLKKDDHDIYASLMPGECDLLHMSIALAGEVGELLDAIKKHVIYRQTLNVQNVVEELGDIEFYLEGLRQRLHIERALTLEANVAKLQRRYPSQNYTNTDAAERKDKFHESSHPQPPRHD